MIQLLWADHPHDDLNSFTTTTAVVNTAAAQTPYKTRSVAVFPSDSCSSLRIAAAAAVRDVGVAFDDGSAAAAAVVLSCGSAGAEDVEPLPEL
jgi:hypothetical protein